MTNIIVFCGKKGSGKNTCSNFLHGYQMRSYGIVEDFGIRNDTGGLIVNTKTLGENGEEEIITGEVDVTREDMEFAEWAVYNMWPFIKNYSFAKELKDICMGLFGLTREQVYGTDEQKNTIVEHLRWENMPGVITTEKAWRIFHNFNSWNYHNLTQEEIKILNEKIKIQFSPQDFNSHSPTWCVFPDEGILVHRTGPMTAREFMQFFGTEVMRKMYEPIWTERTIKNIKTENPQISVVSDCRFKNEALAMKEQKSKLIYLTRSINQDSHASENGFGDFDDFDAVIDNQNMTIEETTIELMKVIDSWGWLGDLITKEDARKGTKKIKQ